MIVLALFGPFRRVFPCQRDISLPTCTPYQATDIFVSNEMPDAAQENEACLIEDDKFVGTTAEFSDSWEILPLRSDLRPKE